MQSETDISKLSTEQKYAKIFGLPDGDIAHADYDIFTGILTVIYGKEKPRYMQKKVTKRATKEFADYFKAPIFIGKGVDYILTAYLKEKNGSHIVREGSTSAKVYYTSNDPAYKMTLNQFIETEVRDRGNYTLKEVQGWMRKYNLAGNDLALWVSPLKWVANRYNLFAEDWDKARFIPESEMSVYEIKGDEGFIIPESNDGEAGYLFVFHRPTRGEAIGYMVYESWTPADVSSIVSKIVQEVKEKPWTATQKRAEIVARLRSASDEIDRNIITEIQSFRPLGAMSEFAEVMMGAGMRGPKKGEPVRTPFGTIVFNEKRVPSKDRVARWDAEHEKAEELRKIVPEYAFALEARPNTTTGNFRVVEHARRLKAQGLLSTEEEKVLDALERYWQSHPELDREKGYGIWAYNLELMVPERLRAEAQEQKPVLKGTEVKQPWEMTYQEFAEFFEEVWGGEKYVFAERVGAQLGIPSQAGEPYRIIKGRRIGFSESLPRDRWRTAIVMKALSEGKKVPEDVLYDLKEPLKHELEKDGGTGMKEQSGKLYTVKVYELVGVPTPVRKSKTVYTNVILERVKEIVESSPNYEYDIFDPQGNPVQFIKLFGRSPDYTAWLKKMDEERRRLEQERRKKAEIGQGQGGTQTEDITRLVADFKEVDAKLKKPPYRESYQALMDRKNDLYSRIKGYYKPLIAKIPESARLSEHEIDTLAGDAANTATGYSPGAVTLEGMVRLWIKEIYGVGSGKEFPKVAPEEKPPSQEVKDWMKRVLNIENYRGGRKDRIGVLERILYSGEIGNLRIRDEALSMAIALGKDLGYGEPPAYGKSLERYYAEKVAAETGRQVPIIKGSDVIKPASKEPLKSAEELYALYTEGYAGATFLGLAQQDTKELADSILFDLRHLNLDPAIYTKDVLMAYAVKWKEWAQKEWDTISAKVKAEKELKWAEEEKKIAEEKKIFWNEVKNLKITDVQVEFAPGEAARGYRNIYLNTYVILENGKRVRMNNEIFKGRDVTEAQKLGLSYFRKRKLFMVGETVEKNVREDFFLILNRYDEYVKQIPVPVQQQFIESGAVTGGTPARQILTVTQPEEYYFGTQVEVMQGADPELEPYFTGTIKRLLNNGELVEVHPEGDPMEVSFRVPVDRVNVVRLVEQQKPGAKPKKEIWQMTQREFNSTKVEKWQGIRNDETKTITGGYLFVLLDEPKHEGEWVTRSTGHSVRNVSNRSEAVAKFHKEQVEKALSEGKLVPEEVLKDYPELVKPKEGKKLYRYYYSHRPPGIGTQPEGFIRHETWMPARTTPHGRTAFGWVEYDRPLTQEEITGYELFEDEAELPKLVSELVQFAKSEGIEEAMKELTSEYGKAVWEWLKSQKRIRAGMGQKEQIRAEILRLAGITEPAAPQQPSPGVQGMFDAYIRSTVLTTGALASPKFLNDEAMAQDIFKNIQVSMDEARRLVPQFRAIAEKRINKEEIESVKETFGIDLEQEAHNLGIDLAEYAIVKAGNKVVLKHKTIVQKRYEIKPPKGYMEEKERRVMAKLEAKRAAVPAVPPAAKPALTIQEIKQQVLGSIQAAGTLEDLQPILKGIGFLPLPEPEKHQLIDAYQNKYSLLLAERPFGAAVKAEEKPKVIGAPTPQQIVEAEQRRRAEEASRLRGQVPLFGGAAVSARLEQFEPGAMEKAKAEAELRKRIEQLGLPSTIHPVIQRLAASTQEVLKFGNKKAKDTVEDIVIRRYVQYCPPGTIIDNRNVPKVPEKWWVYPQKLRTCMTEIEQKLAGAGMVKENTHQELTQSMREYIRGAKDIRDVIHYFRDGRPPVQGVLYRARAGGYFVEASDGNIYDSMGWEDITQVRMSRAARA